MKPSTLSQLQKELILLEQKQVVELCLRLAKYKKENKELLSYLLFDSINEDKFIEEVKNEIDELFSNMNIDTMYFARKSVRKVLRFTNKFIKYSGREKTEIDLRIYFCLRFKSSNISIRKSETLTNLYFNQVEKVKKIVSKLHEDIQFDYAKEIESIGEL